MDGQLIICRSFYFGLRQNYKAPVMHSKDYGSPDGWYIETNDGNFSTWVHSAHCRWCAKAAAAEEWMKWKK